LCDFDWNWPKRCDRAAIKALMVLDFLKEAANIVVVGPNGVDKSTLAQNIAHQALIRGHTVPFTSAGQFLGDLCALDSDSALRRRLRRYARPQLLVIDEVGLSLLFQPPCRPHVRTGLAELSEQEHAGHHQSAVRRRVRGRRPPRPQCRDHRHRR
jgi:hypothetical protein